MELIPIHTENGNSTVLATHLYNFLEPKTIFPNWIKRMLEYGFVENMDYAVCLPNLESKKVKRGGHNAIDYVLTLDCAKAIAMVQRSAKGKLIRNYFIEVERQYKAIASPQQLQALQNRVLALESKQIDYPNDWAIDRYLRVNKLFSSLTIQHRQQLGKLCTKAYKAVYNETPKRVPHPSYINGQNVYPYQLINEVYNRWTSTQ